MLQLPVRSNLALQLNDLFTAEIGLTQDLQPGRPNGNEQHNNDEERRAELRVHARRYPGDDPD
jgi:hypothetical protein